MYEIYQADIAYKDLSLFDSEEAMIEHRSFLSRGMIRITKREVTDKNGILLFMRRQVQTQSFRLSVFERKFYDQLTDYLREGYNVAGNANDGNHTNHNNHSSRQKG